LAQIKQLDNQWRVTGPMTMSHVNVLLQEASALSMPDAFEVNLADVTEVDTASIAVIFEWLRTAKSRKSKITFSHFPANLISLATLYGVIDLIPQSSH
jgi:phospholipid transport system transporter-binding protein